jgi:hypothetical protein
VKHPDAARSPEMSKDDAAEGNVNLKPRRYKCLS